MEYLLTCHCGKEHRVTKSQAGQELPCSCGASVKIPTLRALTALPAIDATSENDDTKSAKQSRSREKSPAWSGWRGPALAISVLLLLISTITTGYWISQALRNDVGVSTEVFIEGSDEAIDSYGPGELSVAWNDFQQIGLKTRTAPTFHLYNVYVEEQWTKAKFGGIAIGVLALLTVSIIVSAKLSKPESAAS
ncbi:MAG: hypothetical protein AB8B50_13180 [Pirellulaceae bacterium]